MPLCGQSLGSNHEQGSLFSWVDYIHLCDLERDWKIYLYPLKGIFVYNKLYKHWSFNISTSLAILIPTWKRPDKLELCLGSILKQSRAPEKIVVVYRLVDEDGLAVIKKYKPLLHDFAEFLDLCVEVPGVIAAENAGLEHISQDIVAFLDDDAEAPTDWVEKIISHFERDSQVVGVGGPDLITGESDPLYPYERDLVGKYTFYGKVIGNHHQKVTRSQHVDVLKGVNMAFLRKDLPPLDTELSSEHNVGNGSQWELDICLAMRKKGTLFFDHTLQVKHNSNHDHFIELLNQRNNAHNLTYVIVKHGNFLENSIALFYIFLVGNTQTIGFIKFIQLIFKDGLKRSTSLYLSSLRGTLLGLRTYFKKVLNQ